MRLMLDVHKASVTACVRISHESEGLHQEIREFAACRTKQGKGCADGPTSIMR